MDRTRQPQRPSITPRTAIVNNPVPPAPHQESLAEWQANMAKSDAELSERLGALPPFPRLPNGTPQPTGMQVMTERELERIPNTDDVVNAVNDDGLLAVKTTFAALHANRFKTSCGEVSYEAHETCFKAVAAAYPDTEVVCALDLEQRTTSSLAVRLTSRKQGEAIENLVSENGGSLRFDAPQRIMKTGTWAYFETE